MFGIDAPVHDSQASSFDRRGVRVDLHCAADAGGPQRSIAGDSLGQRHVRDDVGECQAAGFRIRATSRKTAALSGARLITPLLITTSNDAESSPVDSM
jgi:hypothetical protein